MNGAPSCSSLAGLAIIANQKFYPRRLSFEGNLSGFPILRPAQVASRFIASKSAFAVSFHLFPADSSGPVYMVEQHGNRIRFIIVGLMIQAVVTKSNAMRTNGALREIWNFVGVGYVLPATAILENLSLLLSRAEYRRAIGGMLN